jgi:DNA-binding transcriptional ArsR family regulator
MADEDERAEDDRADVAPLESRTVADVETLRAMADPTRIAILTALMESSREDLPVMSVKELAARLGEPQTKLYRHVRQLEVAGLIRVAATRIVSGILEQRYRANQRDLQFGGEFLREHPDDAETALSAMLDGFRAGFFRAFRDKSLAPGALPEAELYRKPTMFASATRVSPATAAQLSDKLREIMTWLGDKELEDPAGILVDVLIGYYATTQASQD